VKRESRHTQVLNTAVCEAVSHMETTLFCGTGWQDRDQWLTGELTEAYRVNY